MDTEVVEYRVTVDEVAEEVGKLNSLLQDPQPGLSTWHDFFRERASRVLGMLAGLGF